jgi:hypothetical protein
LVEQDRDAQHEGRPEGQLHVADELLPHRGDVQALALEPVAGGREQGIEESLAKKPHYDGRQHKDRGDLYDPGPEFSQVFDQGHPRLVARA